jgi:hypothetical protein
LFANIYDEGFFGLASGGGESVAARPSMEEGDMKAIFLAAALALVATGAQATCKSDAADKKLAGAALTSFMKKCETDAKAKCEADSKSKNLAGAAKASHEKKCVADEVGT